MPISDVFSFPFSTFCNRDRLVELAKSTSWICALFALDKPANQSSHTQLAAQTK